MKRRRDAWCFPKEHVSNGVLSWVETDLPRRSSKKMCDGRCHQRDLMRLSRLSAVGPSLDYRSLETSGPCCCGARQIATDSTYDLTGIGGQARSNLWNFQMTFSATKLYWSVKKCPCSVPASRRRRERSIPSRLLTTSRKPTRPYGSFCPERRSSAANSKLRK
jgi:hypothetical protein